MYELNRGKRSGQSNREEALFPVLPLRGDHGGIAPTPAPEMTLATEFELSGVGLHTGNFTTVKVMPAQKSSFAESGRYFVRVDLPGKPAIATHVDAVHQTTLSTELASGEARVRTVEHLLAALAAMGVSHARIEIDGPEVPLLDGSALPWAQEIRRVGLVPARECKTPQDPTNFQAHQPKKLNAPVWVRQDDAFVVALPSPELRFSYAIEFDLPAIGRQWYSWSPDRARGQEGFSESFMTEIAPARTFGLAHQIDQLRAAGLIKGGSLENALVCGPSGWLNPPLRFANEPVRHKILDLVGDLSLLGSFPVAHFVAYKASHHLHIKLTRLLSQA